MAWIVEVMLIIYSSKDKLYDGSKSLKMIGEDCKKFEANIGKFVLFFLKRGDKETESSPSFEKMRQVRVLYILFQDLAE